MSMGVNLEQTRICSLHFLNGDRQLFDDVPMLFPWNKYRAPRRCLRERSTPPLPRKKRIVVCEATLVAINQDHTYALKPPSISDSCLSHTGTPDAPIQLISQTESIGTQVDMLLPNFCIERFMDDDTGFDSYAKLKICFDFLGDSVNSLHLFR